MNSALLGSVAALAWGAHDFVARYPSRRIGPVNTVLAVMASGFVLLGLWILVTGASVRIDWSWLWLIAGAGIFYAFAMLSLFAALTLGPISVVCPIAGSYPALAVVFAIAGGARPTHAEWLAIAAVIVGVVVVSRSRAGGSGDEFDPAKVKWGIALAFAASACFAVSLTGGQAAVPHFGEAQTVWLARIAGLATIGAVYLLPRVRFDIPASWLPVVGGMGALDVVAMLSTVAAGNLPDPELATVASSGFGAVTVVLAWAILRERISRVQLGGIALVFAGVAVLASR